jgi:hypothetical protein
LTSSNQIIGSQALTAINGQADIALILKGITIGNQNSYIRLELGFEFTSTNFTLFATANYGTPKLYFICVSAILMKQNMPIYNVTGTLSYFNKS